MKFNLTNILSSFILSSLFLLKVKGNEFHDDFLNGTVRAELFTKTDYNVPDIYINMEQESLEELFNQGQTSEAPADIPKDLIKNLIPFEKGEEFKVTNATLEFILNGEKKVIDSLTISVGGQHSTSRRKLGYNIKCNKGNILGRKVLRLRAVVSDASILRSKLSCDVLNRMGTPSISANYARVFFNGKYSGLYVLLDAYKTSWIKKVYEDDKEVSTLYQCNNPNSDFSENNIKTCVNANDEFEGEMKALEEFIHTINAATSREELEDIMDVDQFVKEWIFEWLIGSKDSSLIAGKNYYLYKQINGKWVMLPFDFDETFGYKISNYFDNVYEVPFNDWYENRYIIDVLTKNDNTTFVNNLQYILDNAFNPDLLFPHIDSLKTWLTPYVIEDHTPVNGTYPGYVNKKSSKPNAPFSMEEFNGNCEYTDVKDGIALKKWIQNRYDFVCSYYPVKCNSSNSPKEISSTTEVVSTTTTTIETTTTIDSSSTSPVETPSNYDEGCWSEEYGYPCCSSCQVVTTDKQGSWGAENGQWCGISTKNCQTQYDQCWSTYYGYPCCSHCNVFLTDELGQWGAENGKWCGIDNNRCK